MSARAEIHDITKFLDERLEPTVIRWNRLEGRPRSDDFRRAMRAEVRDAAWMLARQWQMGEFEGDDCGSPAQLRFAVRNAPLTEYAPVGGDAAALETDAPLEPRVERMPIALGTSTAPLSLDIRLALGRRWSAMLRAKSMSGVIDAYARAYPVQAPDLTTRRSGLIESHRESAQMFAAAAAGKCIDGGGVLDAARRHQAGEGLSGVSATLVGPLNDLGDALVAWYARVFDQTPETAWRPDRLEYAFSVDAAARPDAARFVAPDHHLGHVDWHSFDRAAARPGATPAPADSVATVLPTPIKFDGMPNTRWWAFEDGRVNFGDVRPDRVDIGRMLMIEFALVYANDWFLAPLVAPVGVISDVRGIAVTNTFGERTWIEPAGRGAAHGWRGWRMFAMSRAKEAAAQEDDLGLMLPPAAVKILEGPPLEEVLLIRDEMSNLVWGVERIVPLPHGAGKSGAEAAADMLAYQKRWFPPAPPVTWKADRRFELMTTVPENWIPFAPARLPGSNRAIRLQRAAMLRALDGDPDPPKKVEPRTSLLREGIGAGQPYFLFEEEAPRAGARITKLFRRTRARDGRVITWFAAVKRTGRGEGESGLVFDRTPPAPV